jgi:branched-chain amino acid transport system substrate-binding protein
VCGHKGATIQRPSWAGEHIGFMPFPRHRRNMVTALEATDHVGTMGRIQFYGRDNQFTHALKYGPGLVTLVAIQWQSGKQVCVWPADKCKNKITFPPFVKMPN